MTVLIFDWAFACKDILEKLGYTHKSELELSNSKFLVLIDTFLNNGLSVMIEKGSTNHDYTIFVDLKEKRFRQR